MRKSLRALAPIDDAIKTTTNIQVDYLPTTVDYRSPFAEIGKDVYWYVSGSKEIDYEAGANRHVAVFGGDVVISGSLRVESCELTGSFSFDCNTLELTGSIEVAGVGKFTENVSTTNITTLAGDPFLAAGAGISLSVAPGGQITLSATTGVSNIEWNERLAGVTDGSNVAFTMAHMPVSSTTLMVFVNGVLQEAGSLADFTISGTAITFNNPPLAESKVTATYSR